MSRVVNHASERDDSRSPASSMAAVSLGSWFPPLGQRSSSCGPSPASPSPPDTADVVGPPWRGPDHIWLWLQPDNPALSAPSTSLSSATLILPEVMCDTFSTHQYRLYRVIYTVFKSPNQGYMLSSFYFHFNIRQEHNIQLIKCVTTTPHCMFLIYLHCKLLCSCALYFP